jgi:hypothetical protein
VGSSPVIRTKKRQSAFRLAVFFQQFAVLEALTWWDHCDKLKKMFVGMGEVTV